MSGELDRAHTSTGRGVAEQEPTAAKMAFQDAVAGPFTSAAVDGVTQFDSVTRSAPASDSSPAGGASAGTADLSPAWDDGTAGADRRNGGGRQGAGGWERGSRDRGTRDRGTRDYGARDHGARERSSREHGGRPGTWRDGAERDAQSRPGRRWHQPAEGELIPDLPEDIQPDMLDREVRAELRSLARPVAEIVSRRLVAAGESLVDDPELALGHALEARRLAARIPVVREAAGLAAYRAGRWSTAIAELRTYHRMTGRLSHLAELADCERALGRPERAIDLYRSAQPGQLDREEAVELLIVAAGARRDLGQSEAALAMLQVRELAVDAPWSARLRYAYADTLLALDREEEAREWFARVVEVDDDAITDAAERLLELDGVMLDEIDDLDGDDDVDQVTDDPVDGRGPAGAGPMDDDLADLDFDLDEDSDLDDEDDDDEDDLDEDSDLDEDLDEDEDLDDEDDDDDGNGGAARPEGLDVDSSDIDELSVSDLDVADPAADDLEGADPAVDASDAGDLVGAQPGSGDFDTDDFDTVEGDDDDDGADSTDSGDGASRQGSAGREDGGDQR